MTKIGLVLGGGGAKGAYQAGCLSYLRECGISSFEVVTGTSVGALNGAAAACGKIEELTAFWRTISIPRVATLSWSAPPYLLGATGARALRLIAPWLSLIAVGGVVAVLTGQMLWAAVAGIVCASTPFAVLLPTVAHWCGDRLGHRTNEHTSLLGPGKLKRAIESMLFGQGEDYMPARCPVFATAAYIDSWFDPDFPSFVPHDPLEPYGLTSPNFKRPLKKSGWLPFYVNLTELPREQVTSYLLASAALPVAFRRVKIEGRHYSDGGMIENVPLSKALEYPCDLIIVIYLSADADEPTLVLEQIPRLRRALRLARMELRKSYLLYVKWWRKQHPKRGLGSEVEFNEALQHFASGPARAPASYSKYEALPCEELVDLPAILHVIPSRPLGGLLSGTLNFTRRKAVSLVELGRADMKRVLDEFQKGTSGVRGPSQETVG